jgi:competence protein ComEC
MALGGLWICVWRGTVRWLGIVPVMAGFVCIALTPRPDILVADSGGLFAVRDASGRLLFSSLRREKFVREQWQIREGRADLPPLDWPETDDTKPQKAADDRLTCQKVLCLYQVHGSTTAFVFDEKMGSKACKQADIVFSGLVLENLRGCRKQVQILDKWRLRDHGAHSIYIQPDGQVTLQNVASQRGVRPWTGKPYQKREKSEK